ncbi:hypothetical protein [uncultured Arthrobacter sp.]|uniref:hypothetical protein n=1 Tax=uncultured Arthrobacter sp. TaxID=114050 RepID=UPI0026236EFF|nr:hypothetical protein [uncultured Arthrobacter sp.]
MNSAKKATESSRQFDDEPPLDLNEALGVVAEAEKRARRELRGNGAWVYLLWALTWFLGFGTLHGSRNGWIPVEPSTALVLFGLLVAAGVGATIVIFGRQSRGIRGHSTFIGGFYALAWILGFAVMGVLSSAIGVAVEGFWLRGMLINGIAILIVGLLYITGGTTFNDVVQVVMGVWFLVVDIASIIAGPEHFLTVFFIFGSGGFFVGAAVQALRQRRGPVNA